MNEKSSAESIVLNEQEIRLIKMIRDLRYGEIHLYISDGRPLRAEEIKKSVKF